MCCTLRVCEVIFNLLELLIDMGVLKQNPNLSELSIFGNKNNFGKTDKESCNSSEHEEMREEISVVKNPEEKHYTSHEFILNTVLR